MSKIRISAVPFEKTKPIASSGPETRSTKLEMRKGVILKNKANLCGRCDPGGK